MSRLNQQQLEAVKEKASSAHNKLVSTARKKVPDGTNQGAFFATLFQLAAECIEDDVEGFCDRADEIFEEIEAHGQEPQLSEDWLKEVTGEKDNFYFSTDNLVSDLVTLPSGNRGKGRRREEPDEALVVKAVEDAIESVEEAIAVSHSENVQGWVDRIKRAIQDGNSIEFWTLQHITQLSPSALLLGLLLGQEYWFIRQHDFYGDVTVTLNKCVSE